MAREWCGVRIGDLGRVVTGRTPPSNDPAYYGGDVLFLTPSDMVDQRRIEHSARTLSTYGASQLARCLVSKGVGVSCIGWQMGKAILIDRPTVTNQQINSIAVKPSIADTQFVYYSLRSRRDEIFRLGAGGSRTPILNKGDFERLPFVLPPLDEQRAIAHILGTLDDKIELNRRMNETLEAMARALFKSWFVDFDPVRAKAEGRDPGLPKPLSELFPVRLVHSELGMIPEGWECVGLHDALEITDGRTLTPEHRDDSYAYEAFGANGVIGRTNEAWVDSPCIILGKIGSCGSLHRSSRPCWVTNNAFAVRAGSSLSLEYSWWTLMAIDYSQFIGGSANPYMPLKNFGHHVVLRPQANVLSAYEKQAGVLRRRIDDANDESRTLTALRDTLLPKLISGELRIKDAAQFVTKAIA